MPYVFFYFLFFRLFEFKKNLLFFFEFVDFFGEFLNFCDVRQKGEWGYAHIWEMGVSMVLYGDATTPQVFWGTKTDHTLLLLSHLIDIFPDYSLNCLIILYGSIV